MSRNKPALLRVSSGTEVMLRLGRNRLEVKPTTAYFLTYHEGRCAANCAFCTQARESKASPGMLSRISWPPHPTDEVIRRLSLVEKFGEIKRICIQTLNYEGMIDDVLFLVGQMKNATGLPISMSCHPIDEKNIGKLADAGVERLTIPLDAASEEVFEKVKGGNVGGLYNMQNCLDSLKAALKYFSPSHVLSYIMVGLGENELEVVKIIQALADLGIFCGLFAFTPVRGIKLENNPPPLLENYRRIQLAHYLISEKISKFELMMFDSQGRISEFGVERRKLFDVASTGEPFLTKGCPNCNRPCFNESPKGPIYNYPRKPDSEEVFEILKTLNLVEEA